MPGKARIGLFSVENNVSKESEQRPWLDRDSKHDQRKDQNAFLKNTSGPKAYESNPIWHIIIIQFQAEIRFHFQRQTNHFQYLQFEPSWNMRPIQAGVQRLAKEIQFRATFKRGRIGIWSLPLFRELRPQMYFHPFKINYVQTNEGLRWRPRCIRTVVQQKTRGTNKKSEAQALNNIAGFNSQIGTAWGKPAS